MASAGDLTIALDLDTADFRRSMQTVQDSISKVGGKLKKIGSGMKNVGSKLTTGLTLPLAGVGFAAVKLAADFESGMSEVQAISGATGDQLTTLKDKAKAMGASTKFSATESAEAMKFMALAGWDTTKIVSGLDGVMNLAAASGEDLGTVADIVTDSMTGFGMAAGEANSFADLLATTAANANTNVSMLGEAFKYAAPIAGALGFSAADTSHALGMMANSGIKASMAGTSLRSIMTRLAKPTKESGEALEALGIEFKNTDGSMKSLKNIVGQMRGSMNGLDADQKAMYAGMLAGQNAIGGMLSLVNASEEDYNKLGKAIDNSEGKAKKMADTMQDNLSGQLTKLKSALEGVAIEIGDILIPVLKDVVENYIAPMIQKFANLSPSMKKVIVVVAVLVAVLGPLIAFIGMIITGVGALIPVITAISLPLIAWIAGIIAVIAVLVLLWKNNETFRDKVTEIWNNIKGFLVNTFEYIKTFAMEIWNTLKEFWAKNGEEITATFMKIWNSVVDFLSAAFTIIIGIVKFAVDIVMDLWDIFGADILNITGSIFKALGTIISGAFDIITGVLDFFIGLFTGNWGKMWEGIKKVAFGVVDVLKGVFGGLIDIVSGIWDFISGGPDEAEIEVKAKKSAEKTKKVEPKKTANTRSPVNLMKKTTMAKSGLEFGGTFNPYKLASGGIVTKPTLAMIGEGGESEAVIPLSKLGEIGGGGGGGVVINITGNNITDTMDVDIIANRIMNKLKVAGTY